MDMSSNFFQNFGVVFYGRVLQKIGWSVKKYAPLHHIKVLKWVEKNFYFFIKGVDRVQGLWYIILKRGTKERKQDNEEDNRRNANHLQV